jgi:hypothetical protein
MWQYSFIHIHSVTLYSGCGTPTSPSVRDSSFGESSESISSAPSSGVLRRILRSSISAIVSSNFCSTSGVAAFHHTSDLRYRDGIEPAKVGNRATCWHSPRVRSNRGSVRFLMSSSVLFPECIVGRFVSRLPGIHLNRDRNLQLTRHLKPRHHPIWIPGIIHLL